MWAGRNQENYILNKNKRWVHLNTKSILKLFRWVAGTILRNLHYFRSELNEIFPSFPRVSLTDTAVWVSARPSLLCTKAGQNEEKKLQLKQDRFGSEHDNIYQNICIENELFSVWKWRFNQNFDYNLLLKNFKQMRIIPSSKKNNSVLVISKI